MSFSSVNCPSVCSFAAFGFEVGVATQHFSVFVAFNERNPFDSVSDTHSLVRVLRPIVRDAYFLLHETWALPVPYLVRTKVAIRALLSIRAKSVRIEIK